MPQLRTPAPYFGGKARAADLIWERFGLVDSYVEPFFGMGGAFFNSPVPPRPREIINDLDGFVCNVFRSLKFAPAETAEAADWPTDHVRLVAARKWLGEQRAGLRDRLVDDLFYHDPQIAGVWLWSVSCSIGGASSAVSVQLDGDGGESIPVMFGSGGTQRGMTASEARPQVRGEGVKSTVGTQRMPQAYANQGTQRGSDARPHTSTKVGTQSDAAGMEPVGVRVQQGQVQASSESGTQTGRSSAPQTIRLVGTQGGGVTRFDGEGEGWLTGERLLPLYLAYAKRLERTTILSKDWRGVVDSKSVTGTTPSDLAGGKNCGILLDPPYNTEGRDALYAEESFTVADDVRNWCVENGERPELRIALCGYATDYEMPDGWVMAQWADRSHAIFSAAKEWDKDYRREEVIWFSPHCLPPQRQMFPGFDLTAPTDMGSMPVEEAGDGED